jgi:hypothetical protein
MKIFLLDDSDVLGNYLYNKLVGTDCQVYWLKSDFVNQDISIDEFFHTVFLKKAWQSAHSSEHSLLLLTEKDYTNCLFLINVNLKINKHSTRQHQEGIELLKHIRLTEELGDGRNTHVILYSFEEQLQLLKRKPENLIMLSEGVTFFRLPEGLEQWANPKKLSEFAGKRADVNQRDYKRFVQCDFQLPDAAHEFSNWWGVQQLVNAAIICGCQNLKMPEEVEKEIQKLNNKKALFLYGSKEKNANRKLSI